MMWRMATDLGTKIRRARERHRWTQAQLASQVGVSQKTVDNWENGRTEPRNRLGALEHVLGVELGEDGTQDGAPSDPEERQLWDAIGFLPDADRRQLLEAFRLKRRQAG